MRPMEQLSVMGSPTSTYCSYDGLILTTINHTEENSINRYVPYTLQLTFFFYHQRICSTLLGASQYCTNVFARIS